MKIGGMEGNGPTRELLSLSEQVSEFSSIRNAGHQLNQTDRETGRMVATAGALDLNQSGRIGGIGKSIPTFLPHLRLNE